MANKDHSLAHDVLEILVKDSKITAEEIGIMLDAPVEDIKNCIKELENNGTIVKYNTLINWDKTDREYVEALIEVKVTPQRDQGFDAIAERIYKFDEVTSVYLMSGDYDLCVTVEGKTMREVALFVAQKLSTLDSVLSTATHFILKKYKVEGIVLEKDEKDRRQAITL
ncbi:Lrp/AsnC family transcriptional regulator [Xylanivirga thermophila]|jgi:DNA-binding Lrp family transcriptional regulator|uniref:Lrp/AsnC family transcriptional regulator n=1 Tax=Xylanivirga thermophila TaxID=2496273 RepID=UPI00101BEADF|nr:Lrp/AsnC family transcriptional regulator [Xylanivirga thermophila]